MQRQAQPVLTITIDDDEPTAESSDTTKKPAAASSSAAPLEANRESDDEEQTPTEDDDEKDNICIICQDEWSSEGTDPHKVVALPCGHIFGMSCILEWISRKTQCPVCKRRATPNDIRPIFLESSANKLAIKKMRKRSNMEKKDIWKKLRLERKKRKMFEKRLLLVKKKIKDYCKSMKDDNSDVHIISDNQTSSLDFLENIYDEISSCPFECVLDENEPIEHGEQEEAVEDDVIITSSVSPNGFSSIMDLKTHLQYKLVRFMDDPSVLCFDNRYKHSVTIYSTLNTTTTECPLFKRKSDMEDGFNMTDLQFSNITKLLYCTLDSKCVKVLDNRTPMSCIFSMGLESIPNCMNINDQYEHMIFCGLENGQILGLDLRMSKSIPFCYIPKSSPRTNHAHSVTSLQMLPNNNMIFSTLNSGVFQASLNTANFYEQNNSTLGLFDDTTLKSIPITCPYRSYSVSYDSCSHMAAISYSTFGDSNRKIEHFVSFPFWFTYHQLSFQILNEADGNLALDKYIKVQEPEVKLPQSHQFTIYEKVEHDPTPLFKFHSPTCLFSLTTVPKRISIDVDAATPFYSMPNGITLLAYTSLKHVTLVDAKNGGKVFQHLTSDHQLPITSIDYLNSSMGTYFAKLSPDLLCLYKYNE